MGNDQSTQSGGQQSGGRYTQDANFDSAKHYAGNNKIQLAFSSLGGPPGFQAFHTSVVVNGEEFFFDMNGIESTANMASHNRQQPDAQGGAGGAVNTANNQSTMLQQGPSYTLIDFGTSNKTGSQIKAALGQYFTSGTYDLLRKNCNSFSDCAIFFCTGKRIDKKFRAMEQLGASMTKMFTSMSNGQYEPNPKAEGFDVEKIIASMDPAKMWASPGHTLGGGGSSSAGAGGGGEGGEVKPLSAAELREKRLAAMDKRQAEAAAEQADAKRRKEAEADQ